MPVEFGENCWFFLKYTKKKKKSEHAAGALKKVAAGFE